MLGLRSLRNRLAVVFGLIVLGAIGTIYLSVTPRLQDRLRNQRLEALAAEAKDTSEGGAQELPAKLDDAKGRKRLQAQIRTRAAKIGAEILVLRPLNGSPQVLM